MLVGNLPCVYSHGWIRLPQTLWIKSEQPSFRSLFNFPFY